MTAHASERRPIPSDLIRFWERTRLRNRLPQRNLNATPGCPPDRENFERLRRQILSAVIAGCGPRGETVIDKEGEPISARTVPSAGALFPYELYVALSDEASEGRSGVVCVDTNAGVLRPFVAASLDTVAAAAGLAAPIRDRLLALVILVARPWLSMRKYGDRGYLYTCLDVTHAAVGVAAAAEAAELAPVVSLRFRRKSLARSLGLEGKCREPQIMIAFSGPGLAAAAGTLDAMPAFDAQPHVIEPPSEFERRCWETVHRVSSYDEDFPPPATLARTTSQIGWPAAKRSRPDAWRKLQEVVGLRRSARGFLPQALEAARLRGTLSGLDAALMTDCADIGDAGGVSLHIAAARISGLASGIYRFDPSKGLVCIRANAQPEDSAAFECCCMNQRGVRDAAALVVVHAYVRHIINDRGRVGLSELHFHAGHVAHKLCLAAACMDVGITCIGGFDERLLAETFALEPEQDVLYVLALGIADGDAVKLDRAAIPYAHGVSPGDTPAED